MAPSGAHKELNNYETNRIQAVNIVDSPHYHFFSERRRPEKEKRHINSSQPLGPGKRMLPSSSQRRRQGAAHARILLSGG